MWWRTTCGPGAVDASNPVRQVVTTCQRRARRRAAREGCTVHAPPPIIVRMDPLPTGTVTMLFSDIDGSTALLGRLGDRYGEALSVQRRIVRAAIDAWSGWEMGT